IARAIAIGARFLILDEPTAALESRAIERLFERMRRVKASGVAILYISHHLEEIYVLCDGKRIVSAPVTELDHERLVAAMVGGDLARTIREQSAVPVDCRPRLRIRGLSAKTPLGSVDDVSLSVHAGECVGLFGLRGSGAATIADAVVGLVRPSAGEIEVDGDGVGYVPEDRHERGFVPTLSVEENITLSILDRLSRFGIVSGTRRREAADAMSARLQIVASSGDQLLSELSGGNQQKVVVG